MNNRWSQWQEKWDSFSKRERVLLLLTAVAIPVVVIYIWIIEPAVKTLQSVPPKITALDQDIKGQKRVLDLLKSQEVEDPNIAAREELRQLRTQLSALNQEIRNATSNLVSPDQMLGLMKSVLTDNAGVKLVSARSLEVQTQQLDSSEPAEGETDEAETKPKALVYLHPFEIELEGTYQGLYDYLQTIEHLDAVFFWDELSYEVDEYPKAKVRIRVHTLSSEEGWLGA